MSPRAYRRTQRQATIDQTRARILEAARTVLLASEQFVGFTIDAVAQQADVARMTVYNQFGSKIGLLEAVCDSLAERGGMDQLATAFGQPQPIDSLTAYISIFSRFWDADRLITRRLRGLAALDRDLNQVVRARDERRRKGVRVLVQRLVASGHQLPQSLDETETVLYTLIGFETFDTLAGTERNCAEVAPLVRRLVLAALGLPVP